MASSAIAGKATGVTPEYLIKIWRIDFDTAKRTLDVTTQKRSHTVTGNLSKHYSTNDRMLRYKRIREYFYMDTFFATSKGGRSSRGNTCCQLFVTDKRYVHVIPMKSKKQVLQAVKQFAKEIGALDALICDASGEQTSNDLKKYLNDIGTSLRILEQGTPWANKAELYIGLLKESTRKDIKDSNCPIAFWDYCVQRRTRINNLTARSLFSLHGQNPHFTVTGDEGDISNICTFGWYDWCYFRDDTQPFPKLPEQIGRVLGPAIGEGNEMCQWVLKANGKIVPRRTCRPVKPEEWDSETGKRERRVFDALIEVMYGTTMNPKSPSTRRSSRLRST